MWYIVVHAPIHNANYIRFQKNFMENVITAWRKIVKYFMIMKLDVHINMYKIIVCTTLYWDGELKNLLHISQESKTPFTTPGCCELPVGDASEVPWVTISLPSHSPKHQCAINTIYISQPQKRRFVIINQLEHYIHAIKRSVINECIILNQITKIYICIIACEKLYFYIQIIH